MGRTWAIIERELRRFRRTPVLLVMGHRYSSAMWYPMIPALPTAAPEMEHHRGFQTFAAVCGFDRVVATSGARAMR